MKENESPQAGKEARAFVYEGSSPLGGRIYEKGGSRIVIYKDLIRYYPAKESKWYCRNKNGMIH